MGKGRKRPKRATRPKPAGLFEGPFEKPVVEIKILTERIWTQHKARLITEYLKLFTALAKHGTYIDGFAAPQDASRTDRWAAKMVIEANNRPQKPPPPKLRHFHLFDKESDPRLLALPGEFPHLDLHVRIGDFNERFVEILTPEIIGEKEATFCLLDQRTFECNWRTVVSLASHKTGEHKIELFYFLAIHWLDRALSETRLPASLAQITSWFGAEGWGGLARMSSPERAEFFAHRFERELRYTHVKPWPIFRARESSRVMYYMIHASDHPEAPKLMRRAYQITVGSDLDVKGRRFPGWFE
jgi:three-Cys-motif partner protein